MNVLVSLSFLAVLFRGTEAIDYKYHVNLSPGVFDVYWTVDTNDILKRFYFKIVANTTGWAAFAFTANEDGKGMKDYDIALGGVRNGNDTYLHDYWSWTLGKPTTDNTQTQSLTLTNATEANGVTTLEYKRKADTFDTQTDRPIENGTRYFLAWAIAATDAVNKDTYDKHDKKGYTAVGYDMYTGEIMEASTTGPAASTPTRPAAATSTATATPSTTPRPTSSLNVSTTESTSSVIIPSLFAFILVQLAMLILN